MGPRRLCRAPRAHLTAPPWATGRFPHVADSPYFHPSMSAPRRRTAIAAHEHADPWITSRLADRSSVNGLRCQGSRIAAHGCKRRTGRNSAYASALCPTIEGARIVCPLALQPSKGPAVGHLTLWIVLLSAALGTGCTAFTSSGTGRLWRVDALELRRQQRFKHVLSCHVEAIRLSRRQAAARMETSAGVSACPGTEPLQAAHELCWPLCSTAGGVMPTPGDEGPGSR